MAYPLASRLFLLSSLSFLLAGCGTAEPFLSQFRDQRPDQEVNGPMRAPLLNPSSAAAADAPYAVPAPAPVPAAAPVKPQSGNFTNAYTASGGRVLTEPYDDGYYVAEEYPATESSGPSLGERIVTWFRHWSGSKEPSIGPEERAEAYAARKPLPGNPLAAAEDLSMTPPMLAEAPRPYPRKYASRHHRRHYYARLRRHHKHSQFARLHRRRSGHHPEGVAAVDRKRNMQMAAGEKNNGYPTLSAVPAMPPQLQNLKQQAPEREKELEKAGAAAENRQKALENAPFQSVETPAGPPAPSLPSSALTPAAAVSAAPPMPVLPPPSLPANGVQPAALSTLPEVPPPPPPPPAPHAQADEPHAVYSSRLPEPHYAMRSVSVSLF